MTICDFCQAEIFSKSDLHASSTEPVPHHISVDEWQASLDNPCTICSLLLERLSDAWQVKLTEPRDDYPAESEGLANDDPSCRFEDEYKLKARTLEVVRHTLPAWHVRLGEKTARSQWTLRFEAVVPVRTDGKQPTSLIQDFLVYAAQYDANTGRRSRLKGHTNSDSTFNQIAAWMKECESSHPRCRHLRAPRRPSQFVPTRLIDVGTGGSPTVRVIESVQGQFDTTYTTLSHCWGREPGPALQLFEHNRPQLMNRIDLATLPATFRDAVDVTRRLGVRYLWIDSLCIIQKSKDWHSEAPRMEQVYGNAFCNIAAVSAQHSRQGLFNKRRAACLSPSTTTVSWQQSNIRCHVIREDFWAGEILAEPLYRRAWVFQERMLAPRTLHFHKRQVYWQCLNTIASENTPTGLSQIIGDERREEFLWRRILHRPDPSSPLTANDLVDLQVIWRFAVQNYTSCGLTKATDKLMAIAGIAKAIHTASHESYYAGLWATDLVPQLAWRVEEGSSSGRQQEGDYRAPSWAWPSVDGIVNVVPRVRTQREKGLKVLGKPVLDLVDPRVEMGQVNSGFLRVQGQVFALRFVADRLDATLWNWADGKGLVRPHWCRLMLDASVVGDDVDDEVNRVTLEIDASTGRASLQCLVLAIDDLSSVSDGSGIALKMADATTGECSRIGLVEIRAMSDQGLKELASCRLQSAQEVRSEIFEEPDGHVLPMI